MIFTKSPKYIASLFTLLAFHLIAIPAFAIGYRVSDIEYKLKISEQDPGRVTSLVIAQEEILKPITEEVSNYRASLRALESDIRSEVSAQVAQAVAESGADLKDHYFRFNDRLQNITFELSTVSNGGIKARVGPLSVETYTKAEKYFLNGKVHAVSSTFYVNAEYNVLTGVFDNVSLDNFDLDIDIDVDGLLIIGPLIDFFVADPATPAIEAELKAELENALDDINAVGFSLNATFEEILSDLSNITPLPEELSQYQYLTELADLGDLIEIVAEIFMGIQNDISEIAPNQRILKIATSESTTDYTFNCGSYDYEFYFTAKKLVLDISDDIVIEVANFPRFGPNPGSYCPNPGDLMNDLPGTNNNLCVISFTDTSQSTPSTVSHQCADYAQNLAEELAEDIFEDLLGGGDTIPDTPEPPSGEVSCIWTQRYVISTTPGYSESQGCYDDGVLAATRTVGGGPSGNFCHSLSAKPGYTISGSCWSPTVTRL